MTFNRGGKLTSKTFFSGEWKALDARTFWFKNKEGNSYTVQFEDDQGF